ncbi:phosphopyruvate hydratase [Candidatus Woesearchaeota archaeon CG11_big_fil_rev_8_21_14_0_20_43_8]|nr:MAG: phosphopyruvate hydratase [Candidatus Woesearchaeota archaeon CG11_big_fil_rev_8_21_14_0_20_43_8]PIO06762.1 MAG: phosphopyruvate hydratase [Candidatus Woesearchaeota archaeon CG08_land_8_20_14_0_20_43_7]
MQITKVMAREILDSRGNPTIEVDIFAGEFKGTAAVPSGASTGVHEAHELRDGEKRFGGKGVRKAVDNVRELESQLIGMDVTDQAGMDNKLIAIDGTPNKSKLGANAILGISMAVARCASKVKDMPLYRYLFTLTGSDKMRLPVPFCNVINGGKHAGGKLAMQEFMIAPVHAGSFAEGICMIAETYHVLKGIIVERYGKSAINVGDEGGFAPPIDTPDAALDLLNEAIDTAGYHGKVMIAMDPAASEFFTDEKYHMAKDYSKVEMVEYYMGLINKYPIVSIEDPFEQDDFEPFKELTKKAGIQIVGDDLLVTNPGRIKMALDGRYCNALLLKVNQIGTLTEAIAAARMSIDNGWKVMVSHRSGETEDTFIADLAVALGCGQLKSGAPCRGERTCKYNRLIRIESEMKEEAEFASW